MCQLGSAVREPLSFQRVLSDYGRRCTSPTDDGPWLAPVAGSNATAQPTQVRHRYWLGVRLPVRQIEVGSPATCLNSRR